MKGLRKIWAVVVMVATICVSPALFMGFADAKEPLPGDVGEPVTKVPVESGGVDWNEVMLWAAVGVLAVAVVAATLVTIRRYQHHHHIPHPA
jgi:hypothetical protein